MVGDLVRRNVEHLAHREQRDDQHHGVDAVEQGDLTEGQPLLATLEVDADETDDRPRLIEIIPRSGEDPTSALTERNATTMSAK